jgi:hypothetical protein
MTRVRAARENAVHESSPAKIDAATSTIVHRSNAATTTRVRAASRWAAVV